MRENFNGECQVGEGKFTEECQVVGGNFNRECQEVGVSGRMLKGTSMGSVRKLE